MRQAHRRMRGAAKGLANMLGLRTPSRYRNERTRTNRGGGAAASGRSAPSSSESARPRAARKAAKAAPDAFDVVLAPAERCRADVDGLDRDAARVVLVDPRLFGGALLNRRLVPQLTALRRARLVEPGATYVPGQARLVVAAGAAFGGYVLGNDYLNVAIVEVLGIDRSQGVGAFGPFVTLLALIYSTILGSIYSQLSSRQGAIQDSLFAEAFAVRDVGEVCDIVDRSCKNDLGEARRAIRAHAETLRDAVDGEAADGADQASLARLRYYIRHRTIGLPPSEAYREAAREHDARVASMAVPAPVPPESDDEDVDGEACDDVDAMLRKGYDANRPFHCPCRGFPGGICPTKGKGGTFAQIEHLHQHASSLDDPYHRAVTSWIEKNGLARAAAPAAAGRGRAATPSPLNRRLKNHHRNNGRSARRRATL